MLPALYCELCNRDASDQCIIARWHDQNICLDGLASHDAIVAEGLGEA